MVEKMDPKRFAFLMEYAERDARRRTETYEQMAKMVISAHGGTQAPSTTSTSEDAE